MKNDDIAGILDRLADGLELSGESVFRVNSYRKAARTLRELSTEVSTMSEEALKELPGIGESMLEKMHELLKTGKLRQYESMKKKVSEGVMELLRVPGLGPRTVAMLSQRHKVKGIADLEKLLGTGKLEKVKGFGQKKVEKIRQGLATYERGHGRKMLGEALPVAEGIAEAVKKITGVGEVCVAGSVRRMSATVGDIDVLATAKDGVKVIEAFTGLAGVREVLAKGETRGAVRLEGDLQVDLRIVERESYGAALQYFTGSKAHSVHVRDWAKSKGLKINEYGVFRGKKKLAGKDEQEVYAALGMEWVPPEMREDRGEVELALAKKLPTLVEEREIRGDFHVHSKASDGRRTIEEMARACKERGYAWMALTDHSRSLKVARGLSVADLRKQGKEIERLNEKLDGFRVLRGTEVDILADGKLDYPDEALAELDIVIASVHSRMDDGREALTKRVVRAMENGNVDVIGHPTGKRTGMREAMDLDMEAVIKSAAKTGTALEVNGQPERMDLGDVLIQEAVKAGVRVALSTDAHGTEQLAFMRLAVGTARRGWAGSRDVLNTLGVKGLLDWRKGKG